MIRGIFRSGTGGNYVYYVKNASGGLTSSNLPITFVTYLNVVRFVNWLHNGQGNGSTETGAYTISEGQITRASTRAGCSLLQPPSPISLTLEIGFPCHRLGLLSPILTETSL